MSFVLEEDGVADALEPYTQKVLAHTMAGGSASSIAAVGGGKSIKRKKDPVGRQVIRYSLRNRQSTNKS